MSAGPPIYFANAGQNFAQSNNVVATITTELNPMQQELVNKNMRKLYSVKTIKDHNNRITKIIRFLVN